MFFGSKQQNNLHFNANAYEREKKIGFYLSLHIVYNFNLEIDLIFPG